MSQVSTLVSNGLASSVGTGALIAQLASSIGVGLSRSLGTGTFLAAVAFLFGVGLVGASSPYPSYMRRLRLMTLTIARRSRFRARK